MTQAIVPDNYFTVGPNGISQFQLMAAYLGGSAFQTIMDNPLTAYRQLVQQYAKDQAGNMVSPNEAKQSARAVFRQAPIAASLSGVGPRLVGVGFKRIPKFGCLLGISYLIGEGEDVGFAAATGASILSAPFINPIRMIEKQQRVALRETGKEVPIREILRQSAQQHFKPLLRGTIPLMGHSLASATLGLVGQPRLQKTIQKELGEKTKLGQSVTNLIASAVVSPIYVAVTNPLSRLEVIMQTNSIGGKRISVGSAIKELAKDSKQFGLAGIFRGQGIGIAKAIVSLSLFHEGRIFCTDAFKYYNSTK
mmetsp:Transcript_15715/g.25687  ORF Transcript_15715/g.25687 Transcript_15715/m.25687 type:complete len:308 (-) Transcript_15715:30-953(-)